MALKIFAEEAQSFWRMQRLSIVGVKHPGGSSKVASNEDLKNIPIQYSKVDGANIPELRARMLPRVRARFDVVYNNLTASPATPGPEPRLRAPADIIRTHCKNGIMRYVSPAELLRRPTTGWIETFFVKEQCEVKPEYPDGMRLRTISWTKLQNAFLKSQGYKAQVPLEHISAYLEDVLDSVAALRDQKSGFYQIRLPPEKCAALRGIDSEGNVFEMLVSSMGHTSAPECQHLVAQTVAGDPLVVQPKFATKGVRIRTWIDGFKVSGSSQKVEAAMTKIDATALEVSVTFKEKAPPSNLNEFIGVSWDHAAKTVAVAPKTLKKLWNRAPATSTPLDLEAMTSRLLFCSAVRRIPPAHFYLAMKYTRRVLNRCNRGIISYHDDVDVPISIQTQFSEWLRLAKGKHGVAPLRGADEAVMFSDASLSGWGGTYITPQGQVFIAGGSFSDAEKTDNINVLESLALAKCIEAFGEKIALLRKLHVRVDNTSLMFGLQKGKSKSDQLASLLDSTITRLQSFDVAVDVEYISTKLMPADYPSRGKKIPDHIIRRAIGDLPADLRRGRRCAALRNR